MSLTPRQRYQWRTMVVSDGNLTHATRRVLLALESFADADGTRAHPGVQVLADFLRVSGSPSGHMAPKTVRVALAEGRSLGWIERVKQARRVPGGGSADEYALVFPASFEGTFQDFTAPPEVPQNGVSPHLQRYPNPESFTAPPEVPQNGVSGYFSNGSGYFSNDFSAPPEVPTPVPYSPEKKGGYVNEVPHVPPSSRPSPHCPQHPTGTTAPCRGCATARTTALDWDREQAAADAARRSADAHTRAALRRAAIDACTLCDPDGYEGRTLCDHDPTRRDRAHSRLAAIREQMGWTSENKTN